MNRIKLCTALAGVTGLLTGGVNAADGVWTTGKTSDGGYAWTTASYWQDGIMPSEETDNAALQGIPGNSNDMGYIYGTGDYGLFSNVTLPSTLVIGELSGYRHFRLFTPNTLGNAYSFLSVSGYLGSFALRLDTTLTTRAAMSDAIHNLSVAGTPTVDTGTANVELGSLSGEGTLRKTGAGDLRLSGVTGAGGVTVEAVEGKVVLSGVPTAPVEGAAFHIDASKIDTLTLVDGNATCIADTRAGAYPVANVLNGGSVEIRTYGDKQLLNFGKLNKDGLEIERDAKWGHSSAMKLSTPIADVKSMFVVYRWNNDEDDNGGYVFPVNTPQGYEFRRMMPGNAVSGSDLQRTNHVFLADNAGVKMFGMVQYVSAYQCYAPHTLLTGDIRRNGDPVVYYNMPRGYRDELECLSFNMNTNHFTAGALPTISIEYLGRMQNQGYIGGSQLAEVIIYTRSLTDAEQKRNIDYLMAKWGITEGRRPWTAGAVAARHGGEINVPAGETAYVKTIDTTKGPVAKTGAGTLVALGSAGQGVIDVKEGDVKFVKGVEPTEGSVVAKLTPAAGIAMRIDANDSAAITEDAEGVTRWDSSVATHASAICPNSLAGSSFRLTNLTDANQTGKKPVRTAADANGNRWMDFGELTVSGSKDKSTDKSAWLRLTQANGTDGSVDGLREVFFVWKTRPDADGNNPIAIGGGASDWWRHARPGKGCMISSTSAYGASDGNHLAFLDFRNAQWAVNGLVVDPTLENYPAEAHVVRVSLPANRYFTGLGNDNFYTKGGFELGEMILYTRELTDRERVETEAYLMNKWLGKNHPEFDATTAPVVNASVRRGATSSITATAGSTSAADTLPVDTSTMPAILSGGTDFIHLDASDLSTIDYAEDVNGSLVVSKIYDPDGSGHYGAPAHNNKPKLVLNGQNGLPYLDLGPKGNANTASSGAADLTFDTATGGGKSFIIVYSNQPDSSDYANMIGVAGYWSRDWKTGGSYSFFDPDGSLETQACKATVYVDGVSIGSPIAEGSAYPAGFHVVAMKNGGCWGNSYAGVGCKTPGADNCGGMRLCEVYAFTDELSSANLKAASAYLMKKWGIGSERLAKPALTAVTAEKDALVRIGTEVTAVKLVGGGTIQVPSVTGVEELTVAVDPTGCECLTVAGTVGLAATGSVKVNLAPGMAKLSLEECKILDATAFTAESTAAVKDWAVTVTPSISQSVRLEIRNNALYLVPIPNGTVLIFR